ncbi:hypothetical protein AKJ64_00875 [candidate division MSBL1 archaeon SCGC-AAA259E17]|uniref:Uncharacterized protein n=1 Tax=candidate division MSBL1 archaeon SCGC-AAA259E17 TaxID=1698263 RepID=A0A133UGK2_9EURY|nr:hypothetical protein AKJ64_00875 [candidate division MSBL1 archaeon SCGC-AAA259E17]
MFPEFPALIKDKKPKISTGGGPKSGTENTSLQEYYRSSPIRTIGRRAEWPKPTSNGKISSICFT